MSSLAPSGRQVVIAHGEQQAVVVEVGGGVRTYDVGGRPVVDGYEESDMCASGRGQPLLPWPNRLDGGRYRWDGRAYQLALSEPASATAIHGLTRWQRWEVAAAGTSWVTMAHRLFGHPGYPWQLDVAITYRLGADGLHVATTVTNRSPSPAPFGLGFHPYLRAFGGLVDDCTLTLPAATAYDADERGLPVGSHAVAGTADDFRSGRLVGDRRLDSAYTDLERDDDGRAQVVLSSGAGRSSLWLGEGFTHLQVFSGDTLGDTGRRRRGLAVEPMTGPANLLASGDGLRVLEQDAPLQLEWGITAS